VLAGIVIVAGIGLFDLHDFRALWEIRQSEFWLGAATAISVLALGMLGVIEFAIGLSLIVALLRLVRPHTAELGLVDGTDTFRDVDRNEDAHRIPGLLIHRIDDELFFADAAFVVRATKQRLYESDPHADALVIDAEGVSDIDATAIQQLDEFLDELEHAEVAVSMARRQVRDVLERSGLIDRIGDDAIFLEVDDAVEHYLTTRDDMSSGRDD
jgi:SulP family sulfate permease